MPDEPDVIEPDPSPETPADPQLDAAAADPSDPPERPWQNLKGEFDRKFSKVERQLAETNAYLASLANRPAPTPAGGSGRGSLWAGHRGECP